ncbi:flagellar hook-associated protein FlgK [Methylocapsa acidiphila]|uniref:flagellar hook-associated protein FlgK n=1 Tax=Methylocapsa acidiphila TaxID=133552 RepID=UPI0003FF284C|nr:flagellar hook-associated protein FlgK [Methylocapsa acidiphila]
MSLSSAALTAKSGLAAVAAETSILSRNISGNADTAVYSRKIANVATTSTGAQVVSVTRAANQAVFENVLSSTAAAATQSALSSGLDSLNQTIGDISSDSSGSSNSSSPAAMLSAFANALQSYEAQPSDSSVAATAISSAKALASALNSASGTIQSVRGQADSTIATDVQTVNSLLSQFTTLNREIVNGSATGSDVTDALDQRDQVLTELSKNIGIITTNNPNGDMSIYTDSGVTLFQGGVARSVSFKQTNTFADGVVGNAVYVDGTPITGASAAMPIASGGIAGLATLRDDVAPTYQAQLDNIANALIGAFAESSQATAGPDLPGLFTTSGSNALPTNATGLAANIMVNPSVDPSRGGNADLLRDGGISDSGSGDYVYNSSGDASYTSRISQLIDKLGATRSFSSTGEITTSTTLSGYATGSISWLESQRSQAASQGSYQDTLLSTATTAMSNSTGVNLDNEMSKMLDLEQAYSASAKLITAIDSMFNAFMTDLGSIQA